ncbi:MAG: hypothetical protein FK731_08870 [Asgard group archaeon]|nr:hypothetical protein [Asgard group archaeon]
MTIEKFEQDCSFEVYEDLNSVPPEIANKAEEGDLLIKSETLTPEFLDEPWMGILANDSVNQRLLWRHKDPEDPKVRGIPFGRVLSAEINENKNMESWYRIFKKLSDDDPYDKLQTWIKRRSKRGEPVGISKGYIVNRDKKDGNIIRVFSLEDSITYKPKVKQALVQEVIQMENNKDKHTVDNEEMEKLTKELDEAKLQLEEKDKVLKGLEAKIVEFESKLETKETEKKTLEEKLLEISDSLDVMNSKFEQYKLEAQKKPYLDKLKELEDPVIFDIIQDKEVEWLKKRLEIKEKEADAPRITTKTLEQEQFEAEEEELKAKDLGNSVFNNNPRMQAIVAKYEKHLKDRGAI